METDIDIKNQHYVWRHYLKPWTKNKKIWCHRTTKSFKINVEKIAKEHYFYETSPLNVNEKKLIISFIRSLHPTSQPIIEGVFDIYLSSSEGTDFERKNIIEKYQGMIERSAISILNLIYAGDLSFWDKENSKNFFSYFVGVQYMRTKKTIESLEMGLRHLETHPQCPTGVDFSKIAKVMSLFLGDFIGNWLSADADILLIKNSSNSYFITSDQPVYNLFANFTQSSIIPTKMKLFFPISPKLALIFKQKDETCTSTENLDTDYFNEFMVKSSREYIFAAREDDFKNIQNNQKTNHN